MENILDKTETMADCLLKMELPNPIIKGIKKQKFMHPTVVQSAIFSLFGKKSKILVESGPATGKTIGAVFSSLAHLLKTAEGTIVLLVVPHAQFQEQVYNAVNPIIKGNSISCDIIKQRESYLNNTQARVLIGSVGEIIKVFQANLITANDLSGLIFDEAEYASSFGNIHRIVELVQYLKGKISFEKKSVFIVTGDGINESLETIRDSLGEKFTKIRSVDEEPEKDEGEDGDEKKQTQGHLLKDILKQYFYVSNELQMFSAFYLAFKFQIFKGRTIVVTDNLEKAYKLKLFLDTAHIGIAQVYNPEHSLNIRAYNLSLLNGGGIDYLIITKEFLSDIKKYRKKLTAPRCLSNVVFFDSIVNYDDYTRFIGLIKGVREVSSSTNSDSSNNVLFLVTSGVKEDSETKSCLLKLLNKQKSKYGQILFENYPVPEHDVKGFNYRMESVLVATTPGRIKLFRLIEVKKMILKAKSMKVFRINLTTDIFCRES